MSRRMLVSLDLNQNELQNARLQNLATAPSSPVSGQTYYDTVLLTQRTWNGSAWVNGDPAKAAAGAIPLSTLASDPLARANHTGTQLAATVSNFDTQVRTSRLDQLATPAASVAMGGNKLTGLGAPSTAGDSAEYSWVIGQVQSAAAGIASKYPVACIATANIALTGLQTIDGYTTLAGDRVLVTGQTTGTQNGVYNAAAGAWSRTTVEGAAPGELETGALWMVQNGTTNAGTQWRLATTGTITIGSTSPSIVQFGAAASYTAGNGLSLTGSAFAVLAVANGGIAVGPSGVQVDTAVVARKASATIGDGSATSFTVTHNLGTQDVIIQVRQAAAPFSVVECDESATTVNTATIAFASAPAANAYRVTVLG